MTPSHNELDVLQSRRVGICGRLIEVPADCNSIARALVSKGYLQKFCPKLYRLTDKAMEVLG